MGPVGPDFSPPSATIREGVPPMRKRHAARPRLEQMEVRLFPSTFGTVVSAEQVIAAQVAHLKAHASHSAAAHVGRSHAARRHHHAFKHAHHSQPTGSGSSNQTSQQTNVFSNFFKSIFGGL